MSLLFRNVVFICALMMLTLAVGTTPATAAPTKHKHHRPHHVLKHHSARAKTKMHVDKDVMTAQGHLVHLGYLKGRADGLLGPKTTDALKHFQRDHHLSVNGKVTAATYNELVKVDVPILPEATAATSLSPIVAPVAASDFYAKHPDFYGKYDQQYADPMIAAPVTIGSHEAAPIKTQYLPTRYGKLDISEDIHGTTKHYNVTLNGQPVLTSDDQPSVIGISSTYDLGNEDAIIFTTYYNKSTLCPYKHYLMTLKSDGNNLQEIGNCTAGYQAHIHEGSLFVEFPEIDDARAVGNTWRYENGHLEKL